MSKQSIPQDIRIPDFRNLLVWQKAVNLTDKIYKTVEDFPIYEKYMMVSQMIRCSSSISANIAEGNSQLYAKKEFSYINNSLGSAGETRNWIELAKRRGYISEENYKALQEDTDEVIRLLIGYMKKLKKQINN